MYANDDAMYSATGFVSDAGVLSHPVKQSFYKLLNVFNRSSAFISSRENGFFLWLLGKVLIVLLKPFKGFGDLFVTRFAVLLKNSFNWLILALSIALFSLRIR